MFFFPLCFVGNRKEEEEIYMSENGKRRVWSVKKPFFHTIGVHLGFVCCCGCWVVAEE